MKSLLSGKLLLLPNHSLFASLLSFTLSNKMQSEICYREDFNRFKIHCMDIKICLELGTFEEFAVLQTFRPSVPRNVYHHVITFF